MATLNEVERGSAGRRDARERFVAGLHDAGIETNSPLGVLLLCQFEEAERLSKRLGTASRLVETALAHSGRELGEVKQHLTEACRQVRELKESGETRLHTQQVFLERDRRFAIDQFIRAMTVDLKEVLFKELKQKLPFEERRFYALMRVRGAIWIFTAAAVLLGGGYWAGSRHSGEIYAIGRHCEDNLRRDATRGILWCQLTQPDSSSDTGGN